MIYLRFLSKADETLLILIYIYTEEIFMSSLSDRQFGDLLKTTFPQYLNKK